MTKRTRASLLPVSNRTSGNTGHNLARCSTQVNITRSSPLPISLLLLLQDVPNDPADWECQLCFEKRGQGRRPAALSCGHAMYCRPCLEAYFATPAAQRPQQPANAEEADGGEADEGDEPIPAHRAQSSRFRCPVGCNLGRKNELLELFW